MSTQSINSIRRILEIFQASEGKIRPHHFVTGPSGSGKSHTLAALCESMELELLEINAAGLTKEGTAGNSLSKALSPLMRMGGKMVVCFVDEFDKLFISGNSNSQLAHETTNGVQNEFLKVVEGRATIAADYGKYVDVPTDKVLFVFAGAFNGEENIDIDRLRAFGLKTEFLGRVGLAYGLEKIDLAGMQNILENSKLLADYLVLFKKERKDVVCTRIMQIVTTAFEKNDIGARLINTLIHQYFIEGGLKDKEVKKTTFQKTLELKSH